MPRYTERTVLVRYYSSSSSSRIFLFLSPPISFPKILAGFKNILPQKFLPFPRKIVADVKMADFLGFFLHLLQKDPTNERTNEQMLM